MLIQDIFVRDIHRSINGVVKADQLDEVSIWQELDEFVVTRELDRHIRVFFSAFGDALEAGNDPSVAARIGIWVSGFFGSGKSHFLKVLSYLLRNQSVTVDGRSRTAFEFFQEKIDDAMLLGDIRRAVETHTDVVLFNIDSKAPHKHGRDAILQVFLKVLNEVQGFSPDHPHIAHMERMLAKKGQLDAFCDAFAKATGQSWKTERDAYEFVQDEVIEAFMAATGQSRDSAVRWLEQSEENFSLTIENFCKWTRDYLDSKGPKHRLVFLVDEVGQFIGTDSHLMLNLQTITEELGVSCQGRAWIVVTSQEDIDAVLGDMKPPKNNDFSKITGRFKTRLSLSSANVDEVIQSRLLAKTESVIPELKRLFETKGDIIRNQMTFHQCGMTLRSYKNADDFAANYPFAPYQFQLMQKVFEAIRKAGATGLHLSRGERSILDAFQSAGKAVASEPIGVLVPMYRFYPSIESFLDTSVKRTIDQAAERNVEPFDIELLKVLFLIRYVDEVRGNVANLVTLCIDAIDMDRLALQRKIEASLARLEKETLISRSGDHYLFLTNEERDINREIKNVDLVGGEDSRFLAELIFEDCLAGMRRHRYSANKMDFEFNRRCDRYHHGNQIQNALTVSIISPFSDGYDMQSEEKCKLESSEDDGQLLIRLPSDEMVEREVRTYRRTEKYLHQKSSVDLSQSTNRIHRTLADENRERRSRLVTRLKELICEADVYVNGRKLLITSSSCDTAFKEAMEELIETTFTKMSLLKRLLPEDKDRLNEIKQTLNTDDVTRAGLGLNAEDPNQQAIKEVCDFIEQCDRLGKQVVLSDMVQGRFAKRPFGWPELETVLIVARLLVSHAVTIEADGAICQPGAAYPHLTEPTRRRKVTVRHRRAGDPKILKQAREIGHDLFHERGPDGENGLFTFLQKNFEDWSQNLKNHQMLAETGKYPGAEEIRHITTLIAPLLRDRAPEAFLPRLIELKADLMSAHEQYGELDSFHRHQRPIWDKLLKALETFSPNRRQLEEHPDAGPALKRLSEIAGQSRPYGVIKEVDPLIQTISKVNKDMLGQARTAAITKLTEQTKQLEGELAGLPADPELKKQWLAPLRTLADDIAGQNSLAHIAQAEPYAEKLVDQAMAKARQWTESQQTLPGQPTSPQPTPTLRPVQTVRPASLLDKPYIETEEDIQAYLDTLGRTLREIVATQQRIKIR